MIIMSNKNVENQITSNKLAGKEGISLPRIIRGGVTRLNNNYKIDVERNF